RRWATSPRSSTSPTTSKRPPPYLPIPITDLGVVHLSEPEMRCTTPRSARTTHLPIEVPDDRRSSQACTTRFAIPSSAVLPQDRGSYAFLLPTSPSTLSTPS